MNMNHGTNDRQDDELNDLLRCVTRRATGRDEPAESSAALSPEGIELREAWRGLTAMLPREDKTLDVATIVDRAIAADTPRRVSRAKPVDASNPWSIIAIAALLLIGCFVALRMQSTREIARPNSKPSDQQTVLAPSASDDDNFKLNPWEDEFDQEMADAHDQMRWVQADWLAGDGLVGKMNDAIESMRSEMETTAL